MFESRYWEVEMRNGDGLKTQDESNWFLVKSVHHLRNQSDLKYITQGLYDVLCHVRYCDRLLS